MMWAFFQEQQSACERVGFPTPVPKPYAIRRGTISKRLLENAQTLPEFMLQFDLSQLNISNIFYHTKEIYTQSREERRGWDVTTADLRVLTHNYKGHHPGRLKVQQYYTNNKFTCTAEERREFILALAACDGLVRDGMCDVKENDEEEDSKSRPFLNEDSAYAFDEFKLQERFIECSV